MALPGHAEMFCPVASGGRRTLAMHHTGGGSAADQRRHRSAFGAPRYGEKILRLIDQISHQNPSSAVEPSHLHLLDWEVISRAGVNFDARQQHRQLQCPQIGRLPHDVVVSNAPKVPTICPITECERDSRPIRVPRRGIQSRLPSHLYIVQQSSH
jgi:hypothetical protein